MVVWVSVILHAVILVLETQQETVLATLNEHNMGSDEAFNFVFKGKYISKYIL